MFVPEAVLVPAVSAVDSDVFFGLFAGVADSSLEYESDTAAAVSVCVEVIAWSCLRTACFESRR